MQGSVWLEAQLPRFAPLANDASVDVVVIGGGLTGITTAYLLAREGRRVALIERGRVAAGDTAHTTAHLTYVSDRRLHDLQDRWGTEGAAAVWRAGSAAIDQIAATVSELDADCGFRWTTGYLHEPIPVAGQPAKVRGRDRELLLRDARIAEQSGFDAQFLDSVPGVGRPGVRFGGQAVFHPRRYLGYLLDAILAAGGLVFEDTPLEAVENGPTRVRANGHVLRCEYLVVATHAPLVDAPGLLGAAAFLSRLKLYTSFVLAARLPAGSAPAALYWDTADPYDYLRVDSTVGGQCAIFGGLDVESSRQPEQESAFERAFERLQDRLHLRLPEAQVTHRWHGQLVDTDDGLPFVGENAHREFIATGFCGNGFTLGTLAAMMARDRYLGRPNDWFELFRIDRRPFHGGLWSYVKSLAPWVGPRA